MTTARANKSEKKQPEFRTIGQIEQGTNDDIFGKAIETMAQEVPNSILADLLAIIPKEFVIKIVESFSGDILKIPEADTVWRIYRNKIIKEMLDINNARAVRQQLSEYFGIDIKTVDWIYHNEKVRLAKKRLIRPKTIDKSLKRIIASKQSEILREFKKALLFRKRMEIGG